MRVRFALVLKLICRSYWVMALWFRSYVDQASKACAMCGGVVVCAMACAVVVMLCSFLSVDYRWH
jgi:hypothetical protein